MTKSRRNEIYEFEEFRLDAAHLLLYQNDREIPFAPKVVETLLALVERRGEVLSKDELMEIIWADAIVGESNLSQNFYLLRKVLQKTANGKPLIETLKRRGYRFNGDIFPTKEQKLNLQRQTVEPVNAFEACQLARIYFQQSTMPGYIKARELLEGAIRFDADYAPAYIALAELCLKEAIYNLSALDVGFTNAKGALRRALDLKANSAEFYAAKGFVDLVADWNFAGAKRNLQKSLTINPHCAFANNYMGQILMFRCEFDRAETYLQRAVKIEPTGLYNRGMLMIAYFLARKHRKSIEEIEKYLRFYPMSVAAEQILCWNLEQTGRAAEAVAAYEKHLDEPHGAYLKRSLGYAYALAGDKENARKIAAELVLESCEQYISPFHLAMIYAALYEVDEAILHLENALAHRDPWMLWIAADPRFDNLRTDSRFQKLKEAVVSTHTASSVWEMSFVI